MHCKNLERHAASLATSRCAIARPESGPRTLVESRPGGRFLFQGSSVSMGIVIDTYKHRAGASGGTTGGRPLGVVIGLSKFISSDRFGLILASI